MYVHLGNRSIILHIYPRLIRLVAHTLWLDLFVPSLSELWLIPLMRSRRNRVHTSRRKRGSLPSRRTAPSTASPLRVALDTALSAQWRRRKHSFLPRQQNYTSRRMLRLSRMKGDPPAQTARRRWAQVVAYIFLLTLLRSLRRNPRSLRGSTAVSRAQEIGRP